MSVKIIADCRERHSGVIELLSGEGDVDVEIRQLALGDYQVEGEVVFERKTAADFVASLLEGRLFSQAHRLAGGIRRPAFLLEWDGGYDQQKGISRASMEGAMVTLALVFGIPLLWTGSPQGSARMILYTARQLERLRGSRRWAAPGRKPRRNRTIRSRMLQAVPGIGPKSAEVLLDHFGSINAICAADAAELDSIPKLKSAVAERLSQILNTAQEQPRRKPSVGGPMSP